MISQEVEPSNGSSLDVPKIQLVGNFQQDSLSLARSDKARAPHLHRTDSPPPILCLAPGEEPSLPSGNMIISHMIAMDKVSDALVSPQHEEDAFDSSVDEDDEISDEKDDEMSDGDDDVDDLMTLNQYQVEQR